MFRRKAGFGGHVHFDADGYGAVDDAVVQKVSALAGPSDPLAKASRERIRGSIETVRDPVHIRVIRVSNLSPLVPTVVMDVDAERITVPTELVDDFSVVIDGEVDPTVRTPDIRVEPKKPRGMPNGARAVRQTGTQLSDELGHSLEAAPRSSRAAALNLIGLDIDTPNRRNRVHVAIHSASRTSLGGDRSRTRGDAGASARPGLRGQGNQGLRLRDAAHGTHSVALTDTDGRTRLRRRPTANGRRLRLLARDEAPAARPQRLVDSHRSTVGTAPAVPGSALEAGPDVSAHGTPVARARARATTVLGLLRRRGCAATSFPAPETHPLQDVRWCGARRDLSRARRCRRASRYGAAATITSEETPEDLRHSASSREPDWLLAAR